MKFSIVTPTYKRKDLLKRAVTSLINQTYSNWEMIIVNDSPLDESYKDFASSINDSRIRYFVNTTNKGVNFSRNVALNNLSADSRWVLFLDDDDYLAPDTLKNFANLIMVHSEQRWFMTNRAFKNGESITHIPKSKTGTFNYAWSYLILKRIKGDATHCIETKLITQTHTRFAQHVRQGEEWFFFYHIGLHTKLLYSDHNSTISDGYDHAQGLNFRKRTRTEQFETVTTLLYEASRVRILLSPAFLIYITIRYLKLLLPFKQ